MTLRTQLLVLLVALVAALPAAAQIMGPEVRLPDEDIPFSVAVRADAPFAKSGIAAQFASAHPSWQLLWNTATGTPHRAWGPGIQIEGWNTVDAATLPEAARRFVEVHAGLLRVRAEELDLRFASIHDGTGYATFTQRYHGIPVLNSRVDLRVTRDARVFMFGSEFHPEITAQTTPDLGIEAARRFALAGLIQNPDDVEVRGGVLHILPLMHAVEPEYRLVYHFEVFASSDEVWDTYVDAVNGTVLWRKNLVHSSHEKGTEGPLTTVSGKVTGSIYRESVLFGDTTLPMRGMYINIGGKEIITADDGTFSATIPGDSAAVIVRLSGPYALARRADTSTSIKNARISTTIRAGVPLAIEWNKDNSTMSERMAFYHITAIRNFIRSLDTSSMFADVDKQMTGVVNINLECNANWNGRTVNFYRESDRCSNTAEIADVIYHEYGHALNSFTYRKINGQGIRSGAVSEATGDITANMVRDDSRIGLGFNKNAGQGILRNSENTLKYPKDIVNQIHTDGMILTGAVWDVRKAIGIDAARKLTHKVRYGAPDGKSTGEAFFDYFLEMLIADDDDGDLSNGTPNASVIISAFVAHGIVSTNFLLTHTPVSDQEDASAAIAIAATAAIKQSVAKDLFRVDRMRLVYSTDGWKSQDSIALQYDPSTGVVSGIFPGLGHAAVVRYYLEADDNFGSSGRLPETAPATDFMFLLGYRSRYLNSFQNNDGWNIVDESATGAWTLGTPNGTYNKQLGTPPTAPYIQTNEDRTPGSAETSCWVTGNAATALGHDFDDVDSGRSTLVSRMFALSQFNDPLIRYYRWFTNAGGANTGSDPWLVRVSSNGGATWINLEYTTKSDAAWLPKVFRLKDHIAPTDSVVIAFMASDNKPESVVEAALDDFEILDADVALGLGRVPAAPGTLQLLVRPNPLSDIGTAELRLDTEAAVRATIVNALGQEVALVFDGRLTAGLHSIRLNAGALTRGAYLLLVRTDLGIISRNILVTR